MVYASDGTQRNPYAKGGKSGFLTRTLGSVFGIKSCTQRQGRSPAHVRPAPGFGNYTTVRCVCVVRMRTARNVAATCAYSRCTSTTSFPFIVEGCVPCFRAFVLPIFDNTVLSIG